MRYRNRKFNNIETADQWLTEYLLKRRTPVTGRLLHSTRLTDLIYQSFLQDGEILSSGKPGESEPNYEALTQDFFCALYSPVIRRKDEASIFQRERTINKPILEYILRNDRFDTLKRLCEDKELPSYDAAETFCSSLHQALSTNNHPIPELEFIEVIGALSEQIETKIKIICKIKSGEKQAPPEKLLQLHNQILNKLSQIDNLQRKVEQGAICFIDAINSSVNYALDQSLEQAAQTNSILSAWGDGSGQMKHTPVNKELLEHVKNSEELKKIAGTLGKYREMIADKKKNGYAYGRGEKYDLELGNDITRCLSSELALLGSADSEILFMRKYEQKQLLQYRKRASVVKGAGDMIVLIDESSSTRSVAGWAKAFALALLDIAAKDNRKFAMVHFSSEQQVKTDLFEPGHFRPEDVMKAAEQFFGGGTNFEAPLKEALWLMENGYENADITIITDGECRLPDAFTENFRDKMVANRATVTGILLDKGDPCGETLEPFCDNIYHSKELTEDEIAVQILSSKIA